MLGRLYAIIFIGLIIFSLLYQRKYLEQSSTEFNSQLEYKNIILPTTSANQFKMNTYQYGKLKYLFTGEKITYFSDNHFEAEGNIIYQSFNKMEKNIVTIRTQKAFGQVESDNSQSTLLLGAGSRIKNAVFPNDVFFDLEDNKGKANNVLVDMETETIQSKNHFIFEGPQINIKGKGFYYSIEDEEFKIKSNVEGKFNMFTLPKNKN